MSRKRKGVAFEERVLRVLDAMRNKHPDRVRVIRQPKLYLYDGQEVIPDLDLQVDLPFEEARYLIECQDRKRSRPAILHKIKYIKGLSKRNTFIFVYATAIPDATRRALDADGVMCKSFEEMAAFVARLEATLRVTDALRGVHEKDILEIYRRLLSKRPIANITRGVHQCRRSSKRTLQLYFHALAKSKAENPSEHEDD